jgi:flagellar assembly protein FliH
MTGYIPKERSQTYTRWQADDFSAPAPASRQAAGSPPSSAAAPPPEAQETGASETFHVDNLPLPTAEDIERIHNEARDSGYQAGYEEGRKAGHAEGYQTGMASAQTCVEQLQALNQGFQDALNHLDQEVAESLLACALEVARQVTHAAVRIRPEILLPVIQEALAALPLQHGPVTLRVHPDNAALAREHLGGAFSQAGWRIQEDPDIAPGGCRLQAGSSEVDATLPTRWRRVLEAIGVTPEWLDGPP